MKNITLPFKLLGPVICLALGFIYLMQSAIGDWLGYYYFPISFGLVIGIFNNKNPKVLNFIYSILISIITFTAFMVIILLLGSILDTNEYTNTRIFKFIVFLIAPVIVLLSYFKFYKIRLSKTAIISIVLVSLALLIYSLLEIPTGNKNDLIKILLNPYLIWQLVVAITLQTVLYQKDLARLLTCKMT